MAGEDIIPVNQRELKRLYIIRRGLDKQLKQIEVAERLNLSTRQVRRITKRIRTEGDCGIIHRSRGKPSNRKLPQKLKEKVITLYRETYHDFGPTFAREKLFEINKIKVGVQTLRNWLIEAGLWRITRKRKKYRRWRERKHHFGEMLQWDGSHHDWLEGRGPACVLIGQIDDATSKKCGQFYTFEGTMPSFASLKQYIKKHGIPHSIYLDRHSTYKSTKKPTLEDELNNRELLSQFERAAKELGITVIHANSAPAKGRVERSFRTDQDRLVKEMRLAGINTIEHANKFLRSYWPKHNKRFSVQPTQEGNLHRPVPKGMDLGALLCRKTGHPVRNDFTIVHDKKLYQILDRTVGKQVTVEERINGARYIIYNGRRLNYKTIATKPPQSKRVFRLRQVIRPPLDHPLKRGLFERRLARAKAQEMALAVL